jgi:hypothetical protein
MLSCQPLPTFATPVTGWLLFVVCLFLPRMGGLGPSSAPSIQQTRPTSPRCDSKNLLPGLQSRGPHVSYPCACERPIQAIPFARRMYNWVDALGGWEWEGMHAFVRRNFYHAGHGSGMTKVWYQCVGIKTENPMTNERKKLGSDVQPFCAN